MQQAVSKTTINSLSSLPWPPTDENSLKQLVSTVLDAYGGEFANFLSEPSEVLRLLADTEFDLDSAIVATLRKISDDKLNSNRISKCFGPSVCELYLGAAKLDGISLAIGCGDVQQTLSNKKMDFSRILVAVVDDVRVVGIHLAELLVRMRHIKELSDSDQKFFANSVLSIYSPLANKLGMWRFKWELEDLCFKCLNRPEFDRTACQLAERRVQRESYIENFVRELQSLLDRSNLSGEVSGRAKHLYSIWNKLNRKGVSFERLFDVLAVRILVDDIESCYAVLGITHSNWQPIAEEFDDYISAPKPNGYQSIHTAVFGPESRVVEVQIRTRQMHQNCEFGVAAHWRYKEGAKSASYQDGKVRLLRQMMEWQEEVTESIGGEHHVNSHSLALSVYVFTPLGKVVELPVGSTPIDFAYAIHTEIGHRCRGAIVNGHIVPLAHVLNTGDWVEIQTAKSGGPSRDWLSSNQSFCVSTKAKACIRRWFKLEEYGRYQTQGKQLLEKELNKRGLSKVNIDKLAAENGFRNSQVLLTAIGMGELKPVHAVAHLVEELHQQEVVSPLEYKPRRQIDTTSPALTIQGVDNILTNYAFCCLPLPGDDVVGYITASRGISVHKRDCENLHHMGKSHPERIVSVDWRQRADASYPVDLELLVVGRTEVFQEVTAAASTLGIKVIAVNAPKIKINEVGRIQLTVDIKSANELGRLSNSLRRLDCVLKVRRISNSH